MMNNQIATAVNQTIEALPDELKQAISLIS